MMGHAERGEGRLERRGSDQTGAMTSDGAFGDADSERTPFDETRCVWAVDPVVTTVFASSAFARLVGIDRHVLPGQPWFVVLPIMSITTVEWLVHTSTRSPTAILDVRHLEGEHISVVLSRVAGGPGNDHAVFRVSPLGPRNVPHTITAVSILAPIQVDRASSGGRSTTGFPSPGHRRYREGTRRSHAGS